MPFDLAPGSCLTLLAPAGAKVGLGGEVSGLSPRSPRRTSLLVWHTLPVFPGRSRPLPPGLPKHLSQHSLPWCPGCTPTRLLYHLWVGAQATTVKAASGPPMCRSDQFPARADMGGGGSDRLAGTPLGVKRTSSLTRFSLKINILNSCNASLSYP